MADAHAKKHDYHLVDPSPWPFIGSVSAFVLAVGFILFIRDMPIAGLQIGGLVFGVGLIGVFYTMAAWWLDVIKEARQGDHTRVVQLHHRYGMIMFIASEVMFFVAWFWAYFDVALFPLAENQFLRTEITGGAWPPAGIETFDPWHLPLINTLILLCSGAAATWAHHALVHENNREDMKWGLVIAIVLGVIFSIFQVYEYTHAAFGFAGNIYGANFFMATGFHGAHVIIGTIFLAVCLIRLQMGHFTPEKHVGFEAAAWYWHFVDVVWLFLFASIYIWGS